MAKSKKPELLYLRTIQSEDSFHSVELHVVDNLYRLAITNNGKTTTVVVPDHTDPQPPFTHARRG